MAIPPHRSAAAATLLALVALFAAATVAQPSPPSCAANLVPCQPYLASAKPPESCCGPLKQTVRDQLPCLCALYSSDLLKNFGVNLTQALKLPLHCGISNDLSKCSGVSGNSTKAPAASPGGNNSNIAHKDGPVAASGLTILLLFLWSMA